MTHSLDLAVLRLLRDRAKYERYEKSIPSGTLTPETKALIKRFGEFFSTTDAARITFDEFWPFLRSRYPNWKPKDEAHWHALLKPIDKDNPSGLDDNIIRNLLTADLSAQALALIEKWSVGGEVDLSVALQGLVEQHEQTLQRKVKTPEVTASFAEFLQEEQNDVGLHWRLGCLNQSMRPLRPGDFGIIAARPDRGKTSFIADQITHMAAQLRVLHPDEQRPVVWLNNEGPGSRILNRVRQAAVGLTISELVALGPAALEVQYHNAIGGEGMVRVFDIHGQQTYEVAELLRKYNPGVVVFDMIDNIHFAGNTLHGGERTDQLLEAMYQWARDQCVKFDFIGLATSQISDAGEQMQYPQQNMLKDSRTGKQGACDFIITLGEQTPFPSTRFIGCTKNKIVRQGGKYSPNEQVYFDRDRSRFNMPVEVDE